jgi:hypothetical protein
MRNCTGFNWLKKGYDIRGFRTLLQNFGFLKNRKFLDRRNTFQINCTIESVKLASLQPLSKSSDIIYALVLDADER